MSPGFPAHLAALLEPQAYPHPVTTVQLVETHVSWVLLTGDWAYKIKRPVHYAFIDLRSADRRAFFCSEELRLNRRFAPALYDGVCDVVVIDGKARIGGRGEVVERAVRMRQFRREDELDRLLAADRIVPPELEAFGRDLAALHARLPVAGPGDPWGRPAAFRALALQNLAECAQAAAPFSTTNVIEALRSPLEGALDAAEPWLDRRRTAGRVRECHGDLHARNVVRHEGKLVPFDCMEFEPAFRWIDVADELALLLCDLQARERPAHAHAFLGGYLAQSGDYQACRVLDPYKVHRALVRAKVAALSATGAAGDDADGLRDEHRRLIACAAEALTKRTPRLVVMCGLPGSGKTWLAERLAPHAGAVHLRSDVERKRRAGLAELADSKSGVGTGLYADEASAALYQHLADCAEDVLGGRYPVIVDATFTRRDDRTRFQRLATRLGLEAWLVWCSAPPDALRARIADRRRRAADASEADETVLAWQQARFEPPGTDEGFRVIHVDTTEPQATARVLKRLAALQ